MDNPRTWKRGNNYRRPILRRIRDIFDDTYYRYKNRNIEKQTKIEFKQIEYIPEKYKPAISIEDYVFNAEEFPIVISIPKPKITVQKKEFNIPIKTVGFKIEKSKKIIKIKIPTIKMNIRSLKKLSMVMVIVCMLGVLFFAAFTAWRVVDLTDGDYINHLVRYKMQQEIDNAVNPIRADVQQIKQDVGVINTNRVPVVQYVIQKRYRQITIKNGKSETKEW